MVYSAEDRQRIIRESRETIGRVDEALAESQRERDLQWAMAQPTEDKSARWHREAEEAEERKQRARTERAERESAAVNWWAEVDKRISDALMEFNQYLCGPSDEAEAAKVPLSEAGLLVQVVVDVRKDADKRIEAAVALLREEIARLAAPPAVSPKELAVRICAMADQM
jgi:hypothetical protein